MQIEKALLTPNKYSRPCKKLCEVSKIVIHWVGNPNSSAQANRNYFESLKTKKVYASAHYIIGLEGEILLCVPEDEIAYHATIANMDSIGIENCHPDWEGKFNSRTYESLIELCVDLCRRYELDPETDLLRHYDISKKLCPKYYVLNENAWTMLKMDVKNKMNMMSEDRELRSGLQRLREYGLMKSLK